MILDEIVSNKKQELALTQRRVPLDELKRLSLKQRGPKDFAAALRGERISLIAEVKKASPSQGVISAKFDPVEVARAYTTHGAAAISVLTESKYFQGSLTILDDIGEALGDERIPLLRKDFLFDPYQIYESRAHGADALLLVVAVLEAVQLRDLIALTHCLGMACLVEVHDEAELDTALGTDALIIGINNRNLKTFEVDLGTTERLRPNVPRDRILVSESGIKTRTDMDRLRKCGINAVLIGETLISAPNIAVRIRELL